MCVCIAPWGWYSDRHESRRTPFLLGLVLLLGATLLLWLAPNTGVAVLSRIMQGLANTVIWTTGLAIMVDTAGEGCVGEYMGYVGLALNAGTVIAPLLGGVVFARRGYNAVFAMTFGLIALDILLRVTMIERHVAESRKREWYDYAGEELQVSKDAD